MILFSMLVLAAATLVLTVFPLFRPSLEAGPVSYSGEDEVHALRRKKEIVYGNIKDLDFEYKMGKLGELDYQTLRNELKIEAGLLMEKMDRVKEGRSAQETRDALARLSKLDERNCPKCHSPNPAGSKFCSECGHKLSGTTKTP